MATQLDIQSIESRTETDVLEAFASGNVFNAPDSELYAYLNALCKTPFDNERIRHRVIIQGLTIGQLLMKNFASRLDRKNTLLTVVVIILATVSICAQLLHH